jgi:putative addiction module component (TIGR02574 family)
VTTTNVSELLRKALKLPPEARAAIAGLLLESLDKSVDSDAEAAWRLEIERRARDLDTGHVQPVPWSRVKKALRKA